MAIHRELNRLVPVKICPTCECLNLPTAQFCVQCCDNLGSIAPTENIEAANAPFEPDPGTEVKVACPDCKEENGLGAVRCQYCDCVLR
jgi:hypothetical protein